MVRNFFPMIKVFMCAILRNKKSKQQKPKLFLQLPMTNGMHLENKRCQQQTKKPFNIISYYRREKCLSS